LLAAEFLDMFGGYGAIAQGKWDERKTFEYRFPDKRRIIFLVAWRASAKDFFVWGFTMDDPLLLSQTESIEWIKPSEVLSLARTRRHKL
jgi:hypothetical protein